MNDSLNVVHSIASLALRKGGPSYTVTALANAQKKQLNGQIEILASRLDDGELLLPDSNIKVHAVNRSWPAAFWRTSQMLRHMTSAGNTILHDQGIWHPHNVAVCSLAVRHNIPYIISTHGMLEPWALQFGAWKKKLARTLYQNRFLHNARCLIANSDSEAQHIREAGILAPIAVIPNGIEDDIPVLSRSASALPRTALFLSRIHPKKGLIHAIESWAQLRPTQWHLKIVGPDEGGYQQQLVQLVRHHNLEHTISFHGPVTGIAKYQCYQDADLFVLPTYSENFGLVIAEALACGLPVITTTGTPWTALCTYRCGWYIDTGTAPLIAALQDAFAKSPEELQSMGQRGKAWVRQTFRWEQIASQTLSIYQWALNRGNAPDCLQRK